MSRRSTRVYCGNLPDDVRESEVEDIFYKYGRIRDLVVKFPRQPGGQAYAFIEFDDDRDAEDAIRARDGYSFAGGRLRVEPSNGDRRGRDGPRGGGRDGGERRGGGPARHTEWRLEVTNLPPSASWQDLKDFMRKAGDVEFTDVTRDGVGIVEMAREDDMEYAIKQLDDTEFKNRYDTAIVRVCRAGGAPPPARGRSRSPPRGRSRSRSRSPARDASPRGRSRSPKRSRSPSPRRESPPRD